MWKKVRQSISAGDYSTNIQADRDVNIILEKNIPTELVDQKIEEEVEKLRKSRFFSEFDRTRSSLSFGRRLTEGELSGGTDEIRCLGLAWCARVLSPSDDPKRAKHYLELAKTLGDSPEVKIAEAFIISQTGDKASALQALAEIDSHTSRSASLMIVANHDGPESAQKWMTDTGRTASHLDSDGKSFLLTHQLQLGYWDDAARTVGALYGTDFTETPLLHHLAALTTLAPVVPVEFRAVVLTQVPFKLLDFPLASDAVAMDARQTAHKHFLDAVVSEKRLACPRAARMDDEYALWLELRDPAQTAYGKKRLKTKLRESDSALGLVHYALQFGVKLDLDAVERDIDRQIAINGGMTIDTAIARFALAFTKSTPEEVANYIARHHSQLATHIDPKLMQFRQIEMFSRAGLIEKANEILDQLVDHGVSAEEEKNLRLIISKAGGHDSVESRKANYKATDALVDLINLVNDLEDHQHWDDLCKYGRRLFERTGSLRDAERVVNAFNVTHKSGELVGFLYENADLLLQSSYLHMSYAWGLYHRGALLESRSVLTELGDEVDSPDYRALQMNIGIAAGEWGSLSGYIADEYRNRNNRSAQDLIGAAQLALHLGSSYTKGLVFEAAAKAEDDAAVLATAYFIATSAGWEDDPQVFQWLEKAAELSGEDGPFQRMSLKDISDQKPDWDRHESETWRLLAQGQMPLFLAAESLNRTLIDLTTLPGIIQSHGD